MLMINSVGMLIMTLIMSMNNYMISLEATLFMSMNFTVMASFLLDWISSLFMSAVMFISSMILIFSKSYIPKNEYKQFSMLLLCFVMSMLILTVSENIIFMLLGWDGLGLSSYMLVIYYQNFSSAASGMITILSNRLGDMAIILSIGILMTKMNWNFVMNENFYKLTMIMMIIAAISKSAQFPFSAWLPAAMAAPTPISALVHSSTLVTAGVYLLIRTMNNIHPMSMYLLMLTATATTIYASLSANWEQDMKKIIALSTLSQIGMMMFSISIGSMYMAFFHLITHALFKSMMFMTAGIMIHNSSYQDMRHMGMINKTSPIIPMIMMISSMALMGIPFMSGFYSKDMIIEFMASSKLNSFLSFLMISSIGMTAMYSIRMMKFAMKYSLKMKKDNLMLNDPIMEIPLLIMVSFSIYTGAMMMWMNSPTQIFFMSLFMKMLIVMMLISGFMLSMTMSFNSYSYKNSGYIPNSMWFLIIMSSIPAKKFYNLMKMIQTNDKMWQEVYGPNYLYSYMKNNSLIPSILTMNPSLVLTLMLTTPLMIVMM